MKFQIRLQVPSSFIQLVVESNKCTIQTQILSQILQSFLYFLCYRPPGIILANILILTINRKNVPTRGSILSCHPSRLSFNSLSGIHTKIWLNSRCNFSRRSRVLYFTEYIYILYRVYYACISRIWHAHIMLL